MMASRYILLASASLLTGIAMPAFGQEVGAQAEDKAPAVVAETVPAERSSVTVESAEEDSAEIIVTGSRIRLSGYTQPTPVTVVDAEKLLRDSHTDISAAIAQLPSAGAMSSPNTSNGSQSVSAGTAGLSLVNLRNLGSDRTLVLFDGKRAVASTEGGGVDLNLLPQSLIQRIDIVTAGASAAWGSDAVAGVVNIIINKSFEGLAAHAEVSTNDDETRQQAKAEISYGTDLFGGRGHFIVSGAHLYSPDHVVPQETSWYNAQNLVNNPAFTATNGQPRLIHAEQVGLSSMTQGGLITGGPLRGIQFVGPSGTPAPFNFGNVSGTLSNGGTFVNPVLNGQANSLTTPMKSSTLFGYLGYDLTDDIRMGLEVNYGRSWSTAASASYTRQGNINITIDNAYLDPTIRQRMIDLGITSFPFGTTNTNNLNALEGDEFIEAEGLGNLHNVVKREMFRQVLSFEGSLGAWKWDAHVQHSKHDRNTHLVVDPVIANYNRAIDAVRVTTANVGTSGLPVGSIACRSTLTAPTNGCQPLNLFGVGVASPDAIAYINNGPAESDQAMEQYTAGASVQGEPFSTWAGPVAMVVGAEYRRESVLRTADPLSYARAYAAGNFQFLDAKDNNKEAFVEANVPLVSDGFVQSLEASLAGRITDYSSSGQVETWKLGLTSQVNNSVRLRGTISADIRAPSLQELYNPGSTSIQVVSDPFRPGNPTTNIFALNRGNPNLTPEKARTYTAGIVLTPSFVPGLNLSVDWYSIRIEDAIVSAGFPYILAQCAAGNATFCPFIIRDAAGIISTIESGPVNAAFNKTSGIDFQADYRRELGEGRLHLGLIGNYMHEFVIDSLGVKFDQAGSLNRAPPNTGTQGAPKLRVTFNTSYSTDRASIGAQVRAFGKAKLNNAWVEGVDVDDNDVPSVAFLDLRTSYFLDTEKRFQAYLAIDNVLNREPPIIPHGPQAGIPYFYVPTRTDIYDALGRSWRAGIRVKL